MGRKTPNHREEDWKYCLLSIFGVFMPLIYGEGKEKAIRQLKKEIGDTRNRSSMTIPLPYYMRLNYLSLMMNRMVPKNLRLPVQRFQGSKSNASSRNMRVVYEPSALPELATEQRS